MEINKKSTSGIVYIQRNSTVFSETSNESMKKQERSLKYFLELGAKEMAWEANLLPCTHDNKSLYPQHPCKCDVGRAD